MLYKHQPITLTPFLFHIIIIPFIPIHPLQPVPPTFRSTDYQLLQSMTLLSSTEQQIKPKLTIKSAKIMLKDLHLLPKLQPLLPLPHHLRYLPVLLLHLTDLPY